MRESARPKYRLLNLRIKSTTAANYLEITKREIRKAAAVGDPHTTVLKTLIYNNLRNQNGLLAIFSGSHRIANLQRPSTKLQRNTKLKIPKAQKMPAERLP